MKSLAVGCTSALVGLVIGIVLAFGAWSLLARAEPSPSSTPIVSTSGIGILPTPLTSLVEQVRVQAEDHNETIDLTAA